MMRDLAVTRTNLSVMNILIGLVRKILFLNLIRVLIVQMGCERHCCREGA